MDTGNNLSRLARLFGSLENPQKVQKFNANSNLNKEIKHKINTQYLTSILGLINILLIVRTFPYHFFI